MASSQIATQSTPIQNAAVVDKFYTITVVIISSNPAVLTSRNRSIYCPIGIMNMKKIIERNLQV